MDNFVICPSTVHVQQVSPDHRVFTVENQSVPSKSPKTAGAPLSEGPLKTGFTVLRHQVSQRWEHILLRCLSTWQLNTGWGRITFGASADCIITKTMLYLDLFLTENLDCDLQWRWQNTYQEVCGPNHHFFYYSPAKERGKYSQLFHFCVLLHGCCHVLCWLSEFSGVVLDCFMFIRPTVCTEVSLTHPEGSLITFVQGHFFNSVS